MTAAIGRGGFVEIAVEEQCAEGVLTPGRASVDAEATEIKRRIFFAASFNQRIRSGKPASPRFFQQTS